jgi:hypothetical protein
MSSFVIVLITKYCKVDQIKNNEKGGLCERYEEEETKPQMGG